MNAPEHQIVSELLTIGEVAAELRVSKQTVRRWIREGRLLPVTLPSGRIRVPIQELSRMHKLPAAPRDGHNKGARFTP